MIKLYNPDKLTRQPLFMPLVCFLEKHPNAILRQIKADFADYKNIDRQLEDFVQAGYIQRENKHYHLTLPFLETVENLKLDQMVMVNSQSRVHQELETLSFSTNLINQTNQLVIIEETGFARNELTLSNYFKKLKTQQTLSPKQKELYAILGDVNESYALKYMTTFILKFSRKDLVKQKRPDIFVQALEMLGYIEKIEAENSYKLLGLLDLGKLIYQAPKKS